MYEELLWYTIHLQCADQIILSNRNSLYQETPNTELRVRARRQRDMAV